MIRKCDRCPNGTMEAEMQAIPKRIPLPVVSALAIDVEDYLPFIMKKYHSYIVYICTTCGYLEVFLS